jgi:aspartate-semialdehyde dehydrogenase
VAESRELVLRESGEFGEAREEGIEIIFSALPSDIAKEVEPMFAKKGYMVFSNASAYRMDDDVPLVVTEINASHMELVARQQKIRGWSGGIITNPNCSTIILSLALKPIYDAFGIESVIVSTTQAVSGAGYPGVASLDIIDNVIPFIEKEEEKMQSEARKILGDFSEGAVTRASFPISASCHRVATLDGHLLDMHISLHNPSDVDTIQKELIRFGKSFSHLPTAPKDTFIVTSDPFRPQPRLDRDSGRGMSITVGRIRKDTVLKNGVKMTVLGHNAIRGAAGQSILNAEWWFKNGL